MIIRDITSEDEHIIHILNDKQKDFRIANRNNCVIDKLAMNSADVPIAYGIVKRSAEAILLVNLDVSSSLRAKAMRELMKYAMYGAAREGIEQLHCFVSNPYLAESLEKHFGFVKTQDIVLVKNLEGY